MRPIQRGEAPCSFKKYQDAKTPLLEKLGDHCSYCERYIADSLDLEHILPKSKHPQLERDWNNFLLSCKNCNSTKSKKDVDIDQILLPDRDNTFLALVYNRYGRVKANPNLSSELQDKAKRLIELTGLNKLPSPKCKSQLVNQRKTAWARAVDAYSQLRKIDKTKELKLRELIAQDAYVYGFFSVWMTVFADDPDMRNRFIKKFKGTATDCFDADGNPIPRPGGKI